MITHHHYLHGVITDLHGGLVDADEQPADAARRELAEESGLQAAWFYSLGAVATARPASGEKAHLFFWPTDARPAPPPLTSASPYDCTGRRGTTCTTRVTAVQAATPFPLGDAASLATMQRSAVALRAAGGALPARDDELPAAARAAYTVTARRDRISEDRLRLSPDRSSGTRRPPETTVGLSACPPSATESETVHRLRRRTVTKDISGLQLAHSVTGYNCRRNRG
ncbi:NUDIX domain-containing protein [Streptomyces chartreusis]|uniref:NUDIX domain-containing protein n=1 Tax=Streptomyces chartreusis TaxID=1969 RepID=UPI00362F9F0E